MRSRKSAATKSAPQGWPARATKLIFAAILLSVAFALHRASGIVGIPSPLFYAARRGVHVAAQSALVRLAFHVMRIFSKLSK